MKKMKLFPKIFISTMVLFAILILLSCTALYSLLPSLYQKNMEEELAEKSASLSDMIKDVSFESAKEILKSYAVHNGINIILKTENEKEAYQGFYPYIEYFNGAEEGKDATVTIDILTIEGMEAVLLRQTVVNSRDGIEMHLQLTASTRPLQQTREVIITFLPVAVVILFFVSLLFSWLCSKTITKPVLGMVKKTGDMAQLKKDAYFEVTEGDEIAVLGRQMNYVYSQLWEKIDALEQEKKHIMEVEQSKVEFLRAASHELKTPLASLRVLLENMQYNIGKYKDHEVYLGVCVENVDAISRMVQEILTATQRKEKQEDMDKEWISIKEETEEVLDSYRFLIKERGLSVSCKVDEKLLVKLNRSALQKVFSNIIGNAVHYTDAGGKILIRGRENELTVENACTPLTPEQLEHIFEAFYRPDFERSRKNGGNGLGLYIVKQILDAAEIPYCFEACSGGMCFTIKFRKHENE